MVNMHIYSELVRRQLSTKSSSTPRPRPNIRCSLFRMVLVASISVFLSFAPKSKRNTILACTRCSHVNRAILFSLHKVILKYVNTRSCWLTLKYKFSRCDTTCLWRALRNTFYIIVAEREILHFSNFDNSVLSSDKQSRNMYRDADLTLSASSYCFLLHSLAYSIFDG